MRGEGGGQLVVGRGRASAVPERPRRCRPLVPVAAEAFRPQLRTPGDELGEVGDGFHVARLRDPHEPVRVQVVAEEERGVAIVRREQAGAAVVHEVALVDRLETERVVVRREPREHLLAHALLRGKRRVAPERAFGRCRLDDRVEHRG